jgi:hypothetical protein
MLKKCLAVFEGDKVVPGSLVEGDEAVAFQRAVDVVTKVAMKDLVSWTFCPQAVRWDSS